MHRFTQSEILNSAMLNRFITGTTILALALVAARAQNQTPKASTPEERAKAVEIARALESDPLGESAKEQRRWITVWLIEVPDISVKMCSNLLGPLIDTKKNYSTEIISQMLASEAAFVIQNPDKVKDDIAVYTAGVEGSLRAYEAILKAKPKAKWPYLDDLIQKREKGELENHVRATRCK